MPATGFVLGTLLAQKMPYSSTLTIILNMAVFSVLIVSTVKHLSRFTIPIATLQAFTLAIAFVSFRAWQPALDEAVKRADGQRVEIEGVVSSDTEMMTGGMVVSRRFRLMIEKIRIAGEGWKDCRGVTDVFMYDAGGESWRHPAYGEKWRMEGRILRSESGSGRYQVRTTRYGASFVSKGHGNVIFAKCIKARRVSAEYLSRGIKSRGDTVALLHSLVLGYRSSLPRDLYEVFAATGTLHVFAISGLHIGIVASFITCVLRLLRVPKTRWIFYVIPLIVGYTIATGARTSSVRACVMALIYFLSFFLGRRNDTISSLSLAAIVILLWDPSQIFDRGFIYSFIVVLGLVALTPFFFGLMLGSPDDDMDFVEAQLWRIKLKRRFLVILRSLIAMSVSAWLVSAPLTALFFGKFVPVSVLANLFVVPMVSVIAVTGFLSIVFGASIGGLVSFGLNWVNVGFVTVLERILSLLVSLPFASIEINRPAWYFVAVWYVLLMVIGNFSQSTQRKRVF